MIKIQRISFPVNIVKEDEQYFSPHLQWEYKSKASAFSTSLLILNRRICLTGIGLEPQIEPWKGFYDLYKKRFFLKLIVRSILKLDIAFMIRPYIICTNEYSSNFFHWHTEVLPKICSALSILGKEPTVLIPTKKLMGYQQLTLEMLGVNYRLVDNSLIFCRRVYCIENVSEYPGYYNPSLLKSIKERIIVGFEKGSSDRVKSVYITRQNAQRRKIINENKIIEIANSYGFDIYDFDIMSYKEQVELISQTKILISLHGAALTHIMFLDKGCVVLELLPKNKLIDKCYFTLASTMGVDYNYLMCDIDQDSHIVANYNVDVIRFDNELKRIVAQ